MADPRNPVADNKQFLNASIRQLAEFLHQNGYDGPCAPKALCKPTNKDFTNIVLFLFRMIDPNFKCTGKFEDEMVAMFKFLGYPFTIAKSSISAVGSPHAWPSLLAAIMWLVELLNYGANSGIGADLRDMPIGASMKDGSEDVDDEEENEKAFYRYLGKAYGLFLAGKDDQYALLEQQLVSSYESRNDLVEDQIDSMEKRAQALSNEIEEVRCHSAQLPGLLEKKRDYLEVRQQLQDAMHALEAELARLKASCAEREAERDRLAAANQGLEKEVAVLHDRVSTQELSADDVANMVGEKERLLEAQKEASEQRQALQLRIWELEMALRDKVKALEDAVRMYHTVAEQLKLIPHTAKNAPEGQDLSIEIDIRAKKREGLLRTDIRGGILPVLLQIRTELTQATFEVRSQLMTEQETVEEIVAEQLQLREQCDELEAKIKRAEATYKREKESYDAAMELHVQERDAMEARLIQLQDTKADEARITTIKRRIAEAQALKTARRNEHERRRAEMIQAVMDVVAMCANHREEVQQQLLELKDSYAHVLEQHVQADDFNGDSMFGGEMQEQQAGEDGEDFQQPEQPVSLLEHAPDTNAEIDSSYVSAIDEDRVKLSLNSNFESCVL